jgi:hypothetical protein
MTALADALPPLSVLALLLADAWPPILLLLWRMLCRPAALSCRCFAAPCSSRCLAAVIVMLFGRLRRMLGHPSLWTISLVGPTGVVSCVGSVQLFGLVVE